MFYCFPIPVKLLHFQNSCLRVQSSRSTWMEAFRKVDPKVLIQGLNQSQRLAWIYPLDCIHHPRSTPDIGTQGNSAGSATSLRSQTLGLTSAKHFEYSCLKYFVYVPLSLMSCHKFVDMKVIQKFVVYMNMTELGIRGPDLTEHEWI